MQRRRFSGACPLAVFLLTVFSSGTAAQDRSDGPTSAPPATIAQDENPFLRIFLTDGTTLVSYGELARLDDRAVFSMPTSASPGDPQLHLVTLPSDRIDWPRTERYAEAVRADRYLKTRAEQDYARLSDDVAQALSDVSQVHDAPSRLAIVERARKTLAEWPAKHYHYKEDEVRQMLGTLDEAIAELRAAAGLRRFDLAFVAGVESAAPREPLLPAPSPREAVEGALRAASLTASSVERVSLLTTVLNRLDREGADKEGTWARDTRVAVKAMVQRELAVDRLYQGLTRRYVAYAEGRAKVADVRAIRRAMTRIAADDRRLGQKRPEAVASLIGAVRQQLEAAQRLRLARDRWLLKSVDYRKYYAAVTPHLQTLAALKPGLDDIKDLAGSTPAALARIRNRAADVISALSKIPTPEDLRAAHALIVSAAQLATSAADIRREAALSGEIRRARDASSAAAGAMMLADRAASDIRALLKPPIPVQ